MAIWANWKKTVYYLRRNGIKSTIYAVLERLEQQKQNDYRCEETGEEQLEAQRQQHFQRKPTFSILVPLYRTPEIYLTEMITSVLGQTYPELELILADATEDDSVERKVRECMAAEKERYGRQRIVYTRLEHNGGISENSNQALKLAKGDYVGLLDHDDVLTPDALYHVVRKLEEHTGKGSEPLLLYSDEDKCNQDRTVYFEPHYKTDFNLDLLLSNNYICHFMVMKRELIQSLGFRKEYDGAQDFDLVLRAVSRILPQEERIVHIPEILYHWRCHMGSTAENPRSKQYAYEAGKRAVQDMADRMGWKAQAVHLKHLGFYGLEYQPDLFTVRKDVAAAGGKLVFKGHLVAGAYDEAGNTLYQGLKEGFSGYMHRGVLLQDVAAVDIRAICVRPECRELFEHVTGIPYVTSGDYFDWTKLPEGTDYKEISIKLGEALRREGYRICWDPRWVRAYRGKT